MLMSVLLITTYGNQTTVNIDCQDQRGIVEKSFNLTCNVTSQSYVYEDYHFKHNDNFEAAALSVVPDLPTEVKAAGPVNAMDQTYLLHWMLMSVLLITVYGNNTDVNITCPDQTGTVGELLTLNCNVTCKSYVYKNHFFKHNGKNLSNQMEPVDGNRTYYYTIANPTVNDSGVYTLWIQMRHGCNGANFTVTIASEDIPHNTADNNSSIKGGAESPYMKAAERPHKKLRLRKGLVIAECSLSLGSSNQNLTEVMAGTSLFYCVLIQVLLITVYGLSTEVKITCPNLIVTVGEPLHLMCTATCDKCNYTDGYKWSKVNNDDITCTNTSIPDSMSDSNSYRYRYHCTIPSASENHNGTFKFFVQMTTGNNQTTVNVTMVPRDADPTGLFHYAAEKVIQPNEKDRSPAVVVAVMVMFCFSISIMVAIVLRKNINYHIQLCSTQIREPVII
ncbi:hypothetical protein HF521_020847 [Silurus meridionalis]|uniref:Immunoglobulin domain-containing protein n=1 Tax=Silurus meridionalis TaxID=175797 RepID=A0A8T0BEK5_SILME|nr:hypothetical protein HF521_020847 [Silurus meridionalis]